MIDVLFDDRPVTRYLGEILSHAGIAWRAVSVSELEGRSPEGCVFVLAGRSTLDRRGRDFVVEALRRGAALIAVGGTWGLDSLLGVSERGWREDGYLAVDAQHPIMGGLTSSLHVFGAAELHASAGTSLGKLLDDQRRDTGTDAVVVHRVGRGVAVTIGADIPSSVVRFQQGVPIHEDGVPAPDGTAPIDEGVLKCDDGIVLSWEHDRERTVLTEDVPECPGTHPEYPAGDTPWFAQPIADELRALTLQAIAWAATAAGQALPLLGQWPRGLPAVGLISHDSDFNTDASAWATLDQLQEAEIHSTWCMMWGPGYPDRFSAETFDRVKAAGHETALHYNALDRDGGTWGREHVAAQAAWLRREAGIERIASNKNHFTRWEGDVEFFRWLEELGIPSDQTKGPSKKGNVGFLHGSCLPWHPFDLSTGRFIDVLEIPLQTQDLWLTTPYAVARPMLAQAVKRQGVAHFLFHQVHLFQKPDVAEAMQRVIADGRARGLEWWTAEAINDWERLRRGVSIECRSLDNGGVRLAVDAAAAVPGATLVLLLPTPGEAPSSELACARAHVSSDTRSVEVQGTSCHNLPAVRLTCDLPAGATAIDLRFG